MEHNSYLDSIKKQFEYYKMLGEKAMAQVSDEQLNWQANEDSNSMATIVKHLWGNMLSRWTDFRTSDGEKSWRQRDEEFENDWTDRAFILSKWEEGWACLFNAINPLTVDDLEELIYIRNMGHTVTAAINRQLAHYAYHIGQMVYLAKMSADTWQSLSIPRGQSKTYNAEKFSQPKREEHFTKSFLKEEKDGGS